MNKQHELGFFPLGELVEYLCDALGVTTGGAGTTAASILVKAKEAMPMQSCCRLVTAKCASCWTGTTEAAFCGKWGSAMPGCGKKLPAQKLQ